MSEQTLVIVKPDGYERQLTGQIIDRFLRAGLRLEAIRVSIGEIDTIADHYPRDEEWLAIVGSKTLADYKERGLSAKDRLGTEDPTEIGRRIRSWLTDYLARAPIVPMVISGNRSIDVVRKIIGSTIPVSAPPGTIRGDFAVDSASIATEESRPVENLVHASGDLEEAKREIGLWFPQIKTA